ncbi:hypothetical protein SVIOM342S_00420 [Streptomyces violaceorubidus]
MNDTFAPPPASAAFRPGRPGGRQDRHRKLRGLPLPPRAARPRPRRRHDRPRRRDARRAVRAREPSGWRLGDRPGRGTKRGRGWLREDELEEFTQDYEGPREVQAVGPWTLAAALELRNGEAVLSDPGVCRDLAASPAEACAWAEVRRRVPGARVVLQLDEPPPVLRGQVRSASGYRPRAVDRQVVEATLREVAGWTGPRRGPLLPGRAVRPAAAGGVAASPSTSRFSPSVTTTRSVRPSRAAPGCSRCRAGNDTALSDPGR